MEWWTRQCHLQMLCKEFSLPDVNDWSECPKDTNAVERKNRDSKMINTASLRSWLIVLYESDKSCAYQYMAAMRSGDLTYNRTDHEARLKSAKLRREQWKQSYPKDSECQHGPPGKQQHFAATDNCLRFRDSNGVWYRGRITAFDEKTAKRIVYFANDGEQPTCTRTCTRTCTHIGHTYIDITYCHMVAKDNQALKNTGHHHTVCEVGEVKGSGGKYRLCSQLTLAHYC